MLASDTTDGSPSGYGTSFTHWLITVGSSPTPSTSFILTSIIPFVTLLSEEKMRPDGSVRGNHDPRRYS